MKEFKRATEVFAVLVAATLLFLTGRIYENRMIETQIEIIEQASDQAMDGELGYYVNLIKRTIKNRR